MNQLTFQSIYIGYNATLVQGVNNALSLAFSMVAGVIQIIMAFFVAGYAIRIVVGRASWRDVGWYMIKALCVAAILTPVHFNSWVRDLFMTDLPAWASRMIGGGATSQSNLAQPFDNLDNTVIHMISAVRAQSTGVFYIGTRVEIAIINGILDVALVVPFVVWFAARIVTALIIPIGPFVLTGYLFEATRGFADRWIGKLVGLAILTLLVNVLLQIVLTQDKAYIATLASAGNDVDAMVATLWNMATVFGVGALLMLILPGVAAYIGGSVGFSGVGLMAAAQSAARAFKARK